jgi:hypothetical protein
MFNQLVVTEKTPIFLNGKDLEFSLKDSMVRLNVLRLPELFESINHVMEWLELDIGLAVCGSWDGDGDENVPVRVSNAKAE